MAGNSRKKTCYYEVLGGLDRKCGVDEIKAAYRKLALKMHPDKAHLNNLSVEEATSRFQHIQEAYSVLSDVQERAWYDAHREQILKGDDGPGEDPFKTKINLYKYFSSGCYEGFGDKPNSFFSVYSDLFGSIDAEEEEWEDCDSGEEHVRKPPFGNSSSQWADVSAFYKHWLDFCSRKAFGHADKWNTRDGESRPIRRAMEQENKKLRQAAKKEFNAEVRQLVKFVQKRDPRVKEHHAQQAKLEADRAKQKELEREKRKKEEAQERQQRKQAQRLEEEERWRQAEAAKAARRERGEVVSEDEEEDDEEEVVEYSCEACRKSFKSEKQFEQHCKSKKHQQAVAALRRQMEQELRKEAAAAAAAKAAEGSDDSESEAESAESDAKSAEGAERSSHQFSPPARGSGAGNGEDVGDDDSDDEDQFIARFAAGSRARQDNRGSAGSQTVVASSHSGAAPGVSRDDVETGEHESSDGNEVIPDHSSGSKKAQKKARQKALLLEKSREKEHTQDLVQGVKKAQREAKKATQTEDIVEDAPNAAVCAPCAEPVLLEPGADNSADNRCAVCGESFPSRSKMFQHIKTSGHAALKQAPPAEEADTRKKGKKKR